MQFSKLHKDKLDLIEKIIQSENSDVINYMKEVFLKKTSYELSDEQMSEVNEASKKYHSGEEKSFSWEEVQVNILEKIDAKKA